MDVSSGNVVPFRKTIRPNENTTVRQNVFPGNSIDLSQNPDVSQLSPAVEQLSMIVPEEMNAGESIQQRTFFAYPLGTVLIDQLYAKMKAPPSREENSGAMDDYIKALIDRLDQDIRDHKQEVRERDTRLQAEFKEREERFRQEAKEREERIIRIVERIEQKIDQRIDGLERRLDVQEQKIDSGVKHIQVLSITVILGVAAMVVSAIVGIIWPSIHH